MKKSIIMKISLAVYLILLFGFSLRHQVLYWSDLTNLEFIKHSTNLIPLKTISFYIMSLFQHSINTDIAVGNLITPIIAFIPFGILLSLLGQENIKRSLLWGLSVAFVIEISQVLLRRGSFDIDDILLYLVGALVGMVMVRLFKKV